MPSRSNIFVTNYYYHIYNKTIDYLKPFNKKIVSNYFLNSLNYYKYANIRMSLSGMFRLDRFQEQKYLDHLKQSKKFKAEILCYCFMPNHFHLLLKQRQKGGIIKLMSDALNSLTRFFNIINNRRGPLFLPRFRSKPIMSEEHLIHVSRYIHVNPYQSKLIDTYNDIWTYHFSSAKDYVNGKENVVNAKYILDLGYFLGDKKKYQKFVESQAGYNKTNSYMNYVKKWSH